MIRIEGQPDRPILHSLYSQRGGFAVGALVRADVRDGWPLFEVIHADEHGLVLRPASEADPI